MEVGWWRGNLFERSLCCTSCKTSHVFLRACISALTAFTTSLKYSAYAAFPLEMSHSWTTRMSDWLKKSGLFFFFFTVFPLSFGCQLVCPNLFGSSETRLPVFFHNFTWHGRTAFAARCGSSLLWGEIAAQIFVLQKSHGNALTFGCRHGHCEGVLNQGGMQTPGGKGHPRCASRAWTYKMGRVWDNHEIVRPWWEMRGSPKKLGRPHHRHFVVSNTSSF